MVYSSKKIIWFLCLPSDLVTRHTSSSEIRLLQAKESTPPPTKPPTSEKAEVGGGEVGVLTRSPPSLPLLHPPLGLLLHTPSTAAHPHPPRYYLTTPHLLFPPLCSVGPKLFDATPFFRFHPLAFPLYNRIKLNFL